MNPSVSLDLNIAESEFDSDLPGALRLIENVALRSGKRIRPVLMLLVGQILGVPSDRAKPFAVAAEKIHNATLLHDDVMDEAKVRRGRPTMNANGENRRAIIAGDILLTRTLSQLVQADSPQAFVDLLRVLVELTEGEWLQLEARGIIEVDERHLREVARKKTASLISWCTSTPGYLAGYDEGLVSSLRKFGEHLGVAFQMVDDCLDFDTGSGKPYCHDLEEGQVNFVIQRLLSNNPDHLAFVKSALYQPTSPLEIPNSTRADLQKALKDVQGKAAAEIAAAKHELIISGLDPGKQEKIIQNVLRLFPYSGGPV
jgi:geranylgeranyl pyrophosphate synthase